MTHSLKHYALPHEDGCVSIMQLVADVDIYEEVRKSKFHAPVLRDGITQITEEQAAIIRANRPKPPVSESSTPVPQVNIAEIQIIQEENADMRAQLAAIKHDMAAFHAFTAELKRAIATKET